MEKIKEIAKKFYMFEKKYGGKVFLLAIIVGMGTGILYFRLGLFVIMIYLGFLALCAYGGILKYKEKSKQ